MCLRLVTICRVYDYNVGKLYTCISIANMARGIYVNIVVIKVV